MPTVGAVGRQPSRIIVNTGDGKGKSSAAVGVMARAWARGWRVGVVQSLKSGEWNTGEQKLRDRAPTEMRKVKHAFDAGLPARKGLEY
jgi:cob(I)alamin adenosyltransferase